MVFVLEFVVKVSVVGTEYFKDKWNQLDFLILLMSLVSIPCNYQPGLLFEGNGGWLGNFVRVFRVAKTMRLIRYANVFKHIYNTLVLSLPQMANIGSLLFLILYIYTIAGTMIFGKVIHNGYVRDAMNFENFYKGAFTLFVIQTTDYWQDTCKCFLVQNNPWSQCKVNPTY